VATFTDITAGRYAVGTPVVVSGAWVLDVPTTNQVTLGRNECPPGIYCGATLVALLADFSQAQPTPPVDGSIDVYGTVTSDGGIHVDFYR
jgi:hypothetical protein